MDIAPALLCIPDLTGFTKFMIEADIEFSKKIVPPLLRSIINANNLNLKVAEIEGDAILFYSFEDKPPFKAIIDQCYTFFVDFDRQLKELKHKYPEEFKQYISSSKLGIKVVFHHGTITLSEIEGRTKLIGEDVITAHKLLKNHVPYSEYLLFSQQFLDNYKTEEIEKALKWAELEQGEDLYDYIGKVKYKYINCQNFLKSVS